MVFLGQNDDSKSHWIKKASLVDSRTSVTDVKFGPRHLGLLLATCSADGTVRIYEAPDVMNLSQWSLQHEIQCNLPCRYVRSTYTVPIDTVAMSPGWNFPARAEL